MTERALRAIGFIYLNSSRLIEPDRKKQLHEVFDIYTFHVLYNKKNSKFRCNSTKYFLCLMSELSDRLSICKFTILVKSRTLTKYVYLEITKYHSYKYWKLRYAIHVLKDVTLHQKHKKSCTLEEFNPVFYNTETLGK